MEDRFSSTADGIDDTAPIDKRAQFTARQLGRGFIEHDQRNRAEAVDAFAAADGQQFAHIDDTAVRDAAEAYVRALWRKDEIEDQCRVDGNIDPEQVAGADWSPVEDAFRERADIIGADARYATLSTQGWVEHKAGGDYWTPLMEAQQYEIQAAMQKRTYPEKPRSGTGGFGPEPARYVVGVELHDMRRYEEAASVMLPYFEQILAAHDS